jgi:hypothetical protein
MSGANSSSRTNNLDKRADIELTLYVTKRTVVAYPLVGHQSLMRADHDPVG